MRQDDQLTRNLDRIDRNINRCAIVTLIAMAAIALVGVLLTSCGTVTPGDVWNAATNAVSQGGGGSVTTTSTTTTTTTVPSDSSAYRITRCWSGGIAWTGPNMPASWPEQRADDSRVPTCGEVHLKSSKGRAKFDHLRRDTKVRDWKNIHNGYGSWKQWGEPADGEDCELWACNYARTEWVKIGGFKWVR